MLAQSPNQQRIYCLYCSRPHKTIRDVALLCHRNHLICRKCVNKLNRANKQSVQCLVCHQWQHVSQIRVAKINFVDVADEPQLLNEGLIERDPWEMSSSLSRHNTPQKKVQFWHKIIGSLSLFYTILVLNSMYKTQQRILIQLFEFLLAFEILFTGAFLIISWYQYQLYLKRYLSLDHLLLQYIQNIQISQAFHKMAMVCKIVVIIGVVLFGEICQVQIVVLVGIGFNWVYIQLNRERMGTVEEIKLQMHSR